MDGAGRGTGATSHSPRRQAGAAERFGGWQMAANAEQQQWIARVLGIAAAVATQSRPGAGLASWQREREAAIGRLRQLAAAIGGSGDAEARDAVVLVQAIIKNLTAKPDSRNMVTELERWLRTDDILEDAEAPNPFGIELDVREPLLRALAELRADLPA